VTVWTRRVSSTGAPPGPPELHQVRAAAQDLAQQAQRVPGRARLAFQTVADCAIIGTVVISGALAAVHMWKALTRPQRESPQGPSPEPAAAGRHSPRGPVPLAADADEDAGDARGRHHQTRSR
jgi:hypothetical protein